MNLEDKIKIVEKLEKSKKEPVKLSNKETAVVLEALHKIKKRYETKQKLQIFTARNVAIGILAIYIIASIFYIGIDVVMAVTNSYIFEGECINISDHNLSMNGMTLYFFSSFSNSNKEILEGNRIKIDCSYSETYHAWFWHTIENLDYGG